VAAIDSSASDFDFCMGTWLGHNRRLRERLAGCDEWDEFEATCVTNPVLEGLGNVGEFRTDYQGGFTGLTLRLFDPETRLWAIYWIDTRRCGILEPPVLGSFSDGVGVFECADTFEGRPILVRFVWSDVATAKPRWEQSFSDDGGETWETNWVNEWTQLA
jgi:hypothetical protein